MVAAINRPNRWRIDMLKREIVSVCDVSS